MTEQGRNTGAGQWSHFLFVVLKRRKFIFWNTFIVTALALGATFIITPRFTATATILPPQDENDNLFSLGGLIQRFDLSQLLLTGATSSAQLYVAILKSRSVKDAVISDHGLMERYEVSTLDKARRVLGGKTKVRLSSTGLIEVSVSDKDPDVAAELANGFLTELDRINRELRSGEGKRTRLFVEKRLADTEDRLHAAEDSLLAFQKRHPGVALPAEVMTTASAGADLLARRIALGYELELKRSTLQPGAAPLLQKETQLRALDRELESLPALTVEMGRRYRDFKVQEKVFELLSAQYETALIKENKDVPTVDVLDAAIPPDRRSFPRRGLTSGIAFLFSLVIGILIAIALELLENARTDPTSPLHQVVRRGTRLEKLLFGRR